MSSANLLNWIELSRSALGRNIESLAHLAGGRKLAVCIKANAYGHGIGGIVGMLCDRTDVDYLTVHTVDEALEARSLGWKRRIMILGPIASGRVSAVLEHDLEPVVFDRHLLTSLGKLARKQKKRVRTHLKLETGTNRQGITGEELPAFAGVYHRYPELEGAYGAAMHFANIEDTTNHEYAELQLTEFNRLVREMTRLKIKPTLRHTACSAALVLFDKTRFELVRPGIAAYGHWPSKETYLSYRLAGGENDLFRPVLRWKTRVTQIKRVARNAFVGYGCTYRTTAPSRLAVLPIGYSDGYDRSLSNRAHVLIHGRRAPVRGRICMNLTMVDITDIKGVRTGDEVVLMGSDQDETVAAEQLAEWAGTINYEILARLSPSIPRLLVD